jgi:glutamine amidotransferase
MDFSEVTTPQDRVAVIATTPLTDNETWTPITPGTLVSFYEGAVEEVQACTLGK